MSRLEKAKNTFFKTPIHTGVTVASLVLFTYTMNFMVDCVTGNCNKTPEEINAHLHLWQQFVNATMNATTNATTLVSATALSAEQLFAESVLVATTTASFAGAVSAGTHKLASLFFGKKPEESPATATEESSLLVNSTTPPTESDETKTKPNETENYSIPPHVLLPTNVP